MSSYVVQNNWPIIEINTIDEANSAFAFLSKKGWVYRGQNKQYPQLLAPIDRGKLAHLDRTQKLWLEDQSIKRFLKTVKFPAGELEKAILKTNPSKPKEFQKNRISILMLMQHYSTPTRLLDWSLNPDVALYFAVTNYYGNHDDEDCEVWGFDANLYNEPFGPAQWPKNTEVFYEITNEFDNDIPIIFSDKGPNGEWFVMQELKPKFHRMEDQKGYFSITSHFDVDHAVAIQKLFENNTANYCRYIINKQIKSKLRNILKEKGIWQGTLFQDVAGVAGALSKDLFDLGSCA